MSLAGSKNNITSVPPVCPLPRHISTPEINIRLYFVFIISFCFPDHLNHIRVLHIIVLEHDKNSMIL